MHNCQRSNSSTRDALRRRERGPVGGVLDIKTTPTTRRVGFVLSPLVAWFAFRGTLSATQRNQCRPLFHRTPSGTCPKAVRDNARQLSRHTTEESSTTSFWVWRLFLFQPRAAESNSGHWLGSIPSKGSATSPPHLAVQRGMLPRGVVALSIQGVSK